MVLSTTNAWLLYLVTNVFGWPRLGVLLVAPSSYNGSFYAMDSSICAKKKKVKKRNVLGQFAHKVASQHKVTWHNP
jgi:hypothetical protein